MMKITNLKLYFQLIVSWCEPIFREDSMRLTSQSTQSTNYNYTGKLGDFTINIERFLKVTTID